MKGLEMEGKHFDQLTKHLGTGTARRRVLGGMIGVTAALLTGAAVLEAKPKPGHGGGGGQAKVTICHFSNGHGGKYKVLKLGAPGAANHLENHERDAPFVDCCPGDTCASKGECFTTVGCDATGTCAYTVNVSAPCTIGGVAGAGSCNATGQCCDLLNPTICV